MFNPYLDDQALNKPAPQARGAGIFTGCAPKLKQLVAAPRPQRGASLRAICADLNRIEPRFALSCKHLPNMPKRFHGGRHA